MSGNDNDRARRALDAVGEWRFKPLMRDGKPVEARVELPIRVADANGDFGADE